MEEVHVIFVTLSTVLHVPTVVRAEAPMEAS